MDLTLVVLTPTANFGKCMLTTISINKLVNHLCSNFKGKFWKIDYH